MLIIGNSKILLMKFSKRGAYFKELSTILIGGIGGHMEITLIRHGKSLWSENKAITCQEFKNG